LAKRQGETRQYIQQLKKDAEDSLKLAQGVGKVREAAVKALGLREAKAKPAAAEKAPAKAAAKPAARKPAATKPAAKPATAAAKAPA
ncbi:hypothetical protein RSW84_26665, partial [Escherichia coli]|nr:hypothetical protein [Escherichia coli]